MELEVPARPDSMLLAFRERFLQALLLAASDFAIVAIDRHGLIIVWSEGARLTMGWTEAEALRRPLQLFFTEEDCSNGIPEKEMAAAVTDGRAIDERWHVHKDGTRFWANGEMVPLRDADGAHLGFLKILRDQTERRLEAERQRTESAFMRSVLAASADCIKVLDLNGTILFMSEGGMKVMEVADPGFVLGRHWPDQWKGGARVQADAALAMAKSEGLGRLQAYADTFAGRTRFWDVQITAMRDAEGQPERLLCISRDVTAQRQAEERLRDSEAQRRLAVEAADIGIWAFTPHTRSLQWDARCNAVFGLPANAVATYEDALSAIHPQDRALATSASQAALAAGDGAPYYVEYRVIGLNDGIERWVSVSGKTVQEPGEPPRLFGTVVDITPRKRAEEQARLLGDELQHRVKNTLAMVQAIVHQGLRRAETPAEAQAAIDPRLAALGRAHALLTSSGWQRSDLRALIEATLRPHDDGRAGRFVLSGPSVQLSAQTSLSLGLLLHELSTNAVKYGALASDSGRVAIEWTRDGRTQLELVWRETGGPAVVAPTRRGFGSRLIERGLATGLAGGAKLVFAPDGLVCTVDCEVEG